jgi:hypothetical protein
VLLNAPLPTTDLPVVHSANLRLSEHKRDSGSRLFVVGLWYYAGRMSVDFVVAMLVICSIPVCVAVVKQHNPLPSTALLCRLFEAILARTRELLQDPWRLVDRYDAYFHIIVALAAIPTSILSESNISVVSLLGVHSIVMIATAIELIVGRLSPSQEGLIWFLFLKTAALSVFAASITGFRRGVLLTDDRWIGLYVLWLILCVIFVGCVNRRDCMKRYNNWQNRNGSFTLHLADEHLDA